MTNQADGSNARVSRIKVTFKNAPLSVKDVSDYMHNLQAFVDVVAAMPSNPSLLIQHKLRSDIIRTNTPLQLERLSYNSPLEVVFYITTGAGAVALTADRIVSVMIKWEEWKLKRMAAKEAKNDAALNDLETEFLKREWEKILAASPEQHFPETKSKTVASMKRIRSADRFLEAVDKLDVD